MSKRVLVVDDFRDGALTYAALIKTLSNGEFEAEAVYSGQGCLDRLLHQPSIDIILLDIDMPIMNGAQVIKELLQRKITQPLKVIPATAWGEDWGEQFGLADIQESSEYRHLVFRTYDKGAGDEHVLLTILRLAAQDIDSDQSI